MIHFSKFCLKTSLTYDELNNRLQEFIKSKPWGAGDYNGEYCQEYYQFTRCRDWFYDCTYETLIKLWIIPKNSGDFELLAKVYPGVLGTIGLILNAIIIFPLIYLSGALFFQQFLSVSLGKDNNAFYVVVGVTASYLFLNLISIFYGVKRDKRFLEKLLK